MQLRRVFFALLLSSSVALAQGASESLEREARAAFKAGRFKEAAIKFQDAADSATESPRRAKMQLQAAYALFNDKNPKSASEGVRRALETDADLEIVAEFYAPDFLKLVQEVKRDAHPGPPPAPVDISELKRVASEKLKDGHADEVVYDLTHVPPEKLDADAWKLLASAYDATGKPVQAEAARRAASGGPAPALAAAPAPPTASDAATLLAEGRSALAKGDAAAAQGIAARAVEALPTSSEAYRLLGDVAVLRGDVPAAEAAFKKAVELDPKNDAAAEALAGTYLDAKNLDAALPLLQANAALGAKLAPKLGVAARALAKENDPRAKAAYAAATIANPNDTVLVSEQGAYLLQSGDVDAGIAALRRASAAAPTSAITHANLGAALRRKGDAAEAEKEYRQALALDGEYVPALAGLGALLLAQGKPAEAVDPLRRASAKEPTALPFLVRAQRESGDGAGALASAESSKGVEDPVLWYEAGAAAAAAGRHADAATWFERVLAKDPGNAAAKQGLERERESERFLARLEKQSAVQGIVSAK